MIDWQFLHLGAIHAVWAALAVAALLAWLEFRSRGALTAFLSPSMQTRLATQASTGVMTRNATMALLMIWYLKRRIAAATAA